MPPTRSYLGFRGAISCNGSDQLDLATFVTPRKVGWLPRRCGLSLVG